MQRFIDWIVDAMPFNVVVLVFYILGGVAVGIAGFVVNTLIFNSEWPLLIFIGVGGIVGLATGIWTVIE